MSEENSIIVEKDIINNHNKVLTIGTLVSELNWLLRHGISKDHPIKVFNPTDSQVRNASCIIAEHKGDIMIEVQEPLYVGLRSHPICRNCYDLSLLQACRSPIKG